MMRNRSGYTRLATQDEVRAGRPRAASPGDRRCAAALHRASARRRRPASPATAPAPAAPPRPPLSQDWHSEEALRFTAPPEEVPWGSVALALFLMVFGGASFVLAWLHWTQALFGKEQAVSASGTLPSCSNV